ncbi:MAG TPA: helix-turn-helix transcriptional regulator [Allosphingosinicella sp.]|jgi:transcriptional regulator with XRE-family HTH domain
MAARPADLVGTQIRTWRTRRRLSQLDLALDAEISARHLSFIETGRSRPSRAMLLRLAERLRIPPRERNVLLVAGGFAPALPARSLDDPALAAARRAVDKVLAAYEPYPALAIDLHWNLVAANAGVAPFLEDCAAHLLAPPLNVLRLSLHPEGLASRIENLSQWRSYVFRRLEEQVDVSADPVLAALLEELRSYPGGTCEPEETNGAAILLKVRQGPHLLSFLSMTTVFGTPVDITLSELAVEAFLPADAETAALLRA